MSGIEALRLNGPSLRVALITAMSGLKACTACSRDSPLDEDATTASPGNLSSASDNKRQPIWFESATAIRIVFGREDAIEFPPIESSFNSQKLVSRFISSLALHTLVPAKMVWRRWGLHSAGHGYQGHRVGAKSCETAGAMEMGCWHAAAQVVQTGSIRARACGEGNRRRRSFQIQEARAFLVPECCS